MTDDRPRLPVSQGQPRILWKRFAVLASGVVTFVSVVRLVADAAGVERATTASAAVSAASMFVVVLAIGLFAPSVLSDSASLPLRSWRRRRVLLAFSLMYALFNFWYLRSTF